MVSNTPMNTGWKLFWQTVIGRSYPRLIGMAREKSWLIIETVLPVLQIVAYIYIYRALKAPEEYIGFVVVGGAMTAFWMNVLWAMSSQLYWEKETGNLGLYIMAPTNLMAILLGMALGGLVSTTLRALGSLALGSWMFGVRYEVSSFWQLFAVFVLTMVALYGLGMMNSSVFLLLGREAWHFSNLLQEPIYLVSGFYFPVKALNFWVALGASIVPLTLGLDAMRQLVFAGGPALGFLTVPVEMAVLAVLSVVFLVASKFLLAKMERLSIQEGRITENRR
ncbi:MAG TPA: ABC transporter permease [Bellilinea sp.]|nr:ABC transporter permease [Bellilinea sp.]